jgi:hypothetical protein
VRPLDKSGGPLRPDLSGTTTKQVQWESLEIGKKSLEAGHRPDMSSPPDKFGGGTGLVWYPPLEAGDFTRQVR